MYKIFPIPKSYEYHRGFFPLTAVPSIAVDENIQDSCNSHGYNPNPAILSLFTQTQALTSATVRVDYTACHPEAFSLKIMDSGIQITCSTGAGLFYAVKTLTQLASQTAGSLPCMSIKDEPSLDIRGIMLDIGRDKIPTMETLYSLLDLFSDMRINHVQLYMEGFCFQYEEFQYLFAGETPLTPGEFHELSVYAKKRFIDLVPNQNVLGHMEKWLEKPQFNPLAECEDGYNFENIYWRPPMTLDVRDSESFHLAETLLDTLLQQSQSEYVNVNMDEPFELGAGKNKETAEKEGRMGLYFEYLEKLHTYCKKNGKKMMMWGDEVLHHPECVPHFPSDVTLLDWIYEGDADFTSHARLMKETGLRFCLCPGTSSWGSLTGRFDNMVKNIKNAVHAAVEYGGKGIITTDWGDLGHWQYLSVSYPGFAFSAGCSWSGCQSDDTVISWYCDSFIYRSSDGSAFKTAQNLGNYYHLEKAPLYNTTLAFAVMSSKYPFDSVEEFDVKMERLLKLSANIARTNKIPEREAVIAPDYEAIDIWIEKTQHEIDSAVFNTPEGELIRDEMKNGLCMVRHGIHLYHTMKDLRDNKEQFKQEMGKLFEELDGIMKIHHRLWMTRNRQGGFERSTKHMIHLLNLYNKLSRG